MPKPTIFDVANDAGVSIKTVSRVLNQEPNVSASTRQRVEESITVLSYRPDQSARNLASNRSHLIGLVYDDPAAYAIPSGGYILDMQQGALKACKSALSELLIHPCDFRRKNVAAELKTFIEDARLEGIVLAAPLSNMPKIVRAIAATGTPFVKLSPGEDNDKQMSISTNDREVSAELTCYLAGLGHTQIAYIAGDPNHAAVTNRFLGYQDGLRQSGLEVAERLLTTGNNSFESGASCAEKLLALKPPPTAIIAANDEMAAGVIRVANRMGFNVPGQLSVVGFDDSALARQVDPELTTIQQPLVQMAAKAASMLAKYKGEESAMVIPSTIKIRGSTGPAPPQRPRENSC